MKTIRFYFALLIAFFPIFLNAQAPGYLGKRAFVSLNFTGFPAILYPGQNNNGGGANGTFGEEGGLIGFNYEFEGSFSYVTARYHHLSLSVGQFYTGAEMEIRTPALGQELFPTSDFGFDLHELFFRVNVKSISLIYSKFNKDRGALAPMGNHFFYGLKRDFISSEIIDKRTSYYNELAGALLGHAKLGIDQKIALNFFIFGWDNNQIFWDKLILKTGFRIGIPLSLKFFDDRETDPQKAYNSKIFSRFAGHEFFRINLGVGYLLF